MRQKYTFFDGGTIEFDDTRSVKELIAYAFDCFGYYEPFGIDVVSLFQPHHSKTDTGWFTTDIKRSCADEIEYPNELCFAYYLPDTFYFAEGGWGHHMNDLGNHPVIPNPISLRIRFDGFDNTVIINGKYCFHDIINALIRTGYISDKCKSLKVLPVGCANKSYSIPFSDPIMRFSLTDFEKAIQQYNSKYIKSEQGDCIYHEILQIC
ncbi:MAG: hypothetical protein ACI4I3_07510 [Acutalibacteraceae bacterium]